MIGNTRNPLRFDTASYVSNDFGIRVHNAAIKNSEYILCSAVKYKDSIICGRRHNDCYSVLRMFGVKEDAMPDRECEGFLTSLDRFVNRTEAFHIAKKQNQIISSTIMYIEAELRSEDLWEDLYEN